MAYKYTLALIVVAFMAMSTEAYVKSGRLQERENDYQSSTNSRGTTFDTTSRGHQGHHGQGEFDVHGRGQDRHFGGGQYGSEQGRFDRGQGSQFGHGQDSQFGRGQGSAQFGNVHSTQGRHEGGYKTHGY